MSRNKTFVPAKLSDLERGVIGATAQGLPASEIADRFELSVPQVYYAQRVVKERYRARNLAHAVALAIVYRDVDPTSVTDLAKD